jgi:hypothetical protein
MTPEDGMLLAGGAVLLILAMLLIRRALTDVPTTRPNQRPPDDPQGGERGT